MLQSVWNEASQSFQDGDGDEVDETREFEKYYLDYFLVANGSSVPLFVVLVSISLVARFLFPYVLLPMLLTN